MSEATNQTTAELIPLRFPDPNRTALALFSSELNISQQLIASYLKSSSANEDPELRATILKSMDEVATGLLSEPATLIKLLSEQASLDYGLLKVAEIRELSDGNSKDPNEFFSKETERKHRKFLATCRTITLVRQVIKRQKRNQRR